MIATTKAILVLIATCILLTGAFLIERGHAAKVTRQRDTAVAQVATDKQVLAETVAGYESNIKTISANEAKARKASDEYQQALSQLNADYDAVRARLRAAGGLRITRAICGPETSGAPAAAGAGRPDGAPTATVALPEKTSDDLLRLTQEADAIGLQLSNLQNWVRQNGMYGEAVK